MNVSQCLEHARIRVEPGHIGGGLQGELDSIAANLQKGVDSGLLWTLVGIGMHNERPGREDGGMVATQLQQGGLTTEWRVPRLNQGWREVSTPLFELKEEAADATQAVVFRDILKRIHLPPYLGNQLGESRTIVSWNGSAWSGLLTRLGESSQWCNSH